MTDTIRDDAERLLNQILDCYQDHAVRPVGLDIQADFIERALRRAQVDAIRFFVNMRMFGVDHRKTPQQVYDNLRERLYDYATKIEKKVEW